MSMDHSPMCSVDQPCRGARFARLRALLALLAASCIGVAVAGTAIAGQFEDGAAAYQRGDYEAAYLRWHSIAELGDRNAQYNIARLYYQGKGVPQDLVEAYKWFDIAASRFSAADAKNRDEVVKRRDVVAASMTPEEIAEAQKKSSRVEA
jgi:TPR repeat protein